MRTGFLLATSIAALGAIAYIQLPAEARGPGSGYTATMAPPAKAKPRTKRTRVMGFRAPAKGPGRCGTYMYWKGGKCNDARAK